MEKALNRKKVRKGEKGFGNGVVFCDSGKNFVAITESGFGEKEKNCLHPSKHTKNVYKNAISTT